MKRISCSLSLVVACVFLLGMLDSLRVSEGKAAPEKQAAAGQGVPKRVPWTTSRIKGSPEPPHPYRLERVFPRLAFKNPLLLTTAPNSDRFFVGEQAGRLFSFRKDPACAQADPFLDLTQELQSWDRDGKVRGVGAVYALAFHPQFLKNRFCYICYVLDSKNRGEDLPDGTRISRFRVTETDPPRCDPKSEKVIITWVAGGHNGCDLQFGPDGYLYISTGDATPPNPPDALDTGQDVTDLPSSILRINVDREEKGRPYAIPPDNPFTPDPTRAAKKSAGANAASSSTSPVFPMYVEKVRPEIWAYGFRNPWRMSFDRENGDLWVGDVGWELWEMVFRIRKGGNYGWSVMEGRQPVRPESRRGPTPILPPTIEFPHTEAASITGGFVYHGKRLKDLAGAYVCGDWVTRKFWATRFEGDKIVSHQEIAQSSQRVVAFAEDNDGELYILDYDEKGGIYRFVPNEAVKDYRADFPRKLSGTGLFRSVQDHDPAPGVMPFAINAEQWADHAVAERFLALPGESRVEMYDRTVNIPGTFFSGQVFFPRDGVLAKTVSIEMEQGKPSSRRRLETQVLHYDGVQWHGYTYQWNDEQTDAVLLAAPSQERTLLVSDPKAPGGKHKLNWHFPSRTECLTCHNPWSGYTLAFTLAQLNRNQGEATGNQLQALKQAGFIELLRRDDETKKSRPLRDLPQVRLTNPSDPKADINDRARSYLHVNCSHCHQFGAGGTADIELRFGNPLEQTKTLEVRPVQGTFEIPGAHILSPGDPYRSVLYYRMAKLGRGRMPHIGSEIVDERGLRLIHDWIRQLPVRKDERQLIDRLRALDEPAILAREQADWARRVRRQAEARARDQGRETPSDADLKQAENEQKTRAAEGARTRAAERADAIGRLLASTTGALMLARALEEETFPGSVRAQVLAAAIALPSPQVRDLFERFVPDEQRVKRLGSIIKPEQILALKGDAGRGRELFFKSSGLQCINCHRVGSSGSPLGPDLGQIARKHGRAQLLESILEPSKTIEPPFVSYLLETTDGKFHTGLLAMKSDQEVVLKVVGDKEVRVPAGKVAMLAPQPKSIMPELLLRDLTVEQAADLLEFLTTLK